MKTTVAASLLVIFFLPTLLRAQDSKKALPDSPSSQVTPQASGDISGIDSPAVDAARSGPIGRSPATHSPATTAGFALDNKFSYYMTETYLNPGALTAPAFRAGLRMANPPGKGASRYPLDWRQGPEGFGRNYGDAVAERVSFQTARFVTGVMVREDPRYMPSGSHNILARSLHALSFSFIDHSDSGHPMPALSNFLGAAAGGFVGNAYLPDGFNDVTHAGQRATIRFGTFAAGNLFREFAPQMPRPMRTFFMLIAR